MVMAWSRSVSDLDCRVAEQLRIRLRDGETELLLYVLFEGGCRVRVTVEFQFLVPLPFDARRQDDT